MQRPQFARGARWSIGLASLLCNLAGAQTALTPNQQSMAGYLKTVCAQLTPAATAAPALTGGQQDLAKRCAFFQGANFTSASLYNDYNAILGQQINALGPETKKFGSLQQDNLAARLDEVRRGARGASFSGLTLVGDDGAVLANGTSGLSDYLPGGASGDGDGGFLDGRLGIFLNGSLKVGSKRYLVSPLAAKNNSFAFDISDNSLTLGADYRVGTHFVFGAAVGSGKTTTDFSNSLGRLDLTANGVSVYASFYGATYYVDALAGYGVPKLNTDRHIAYTETSSGAAVDQEAYGSTHLHDLWAGMSAGRPFYWHAFTLTPEASMNFHEIRLDQFSESLSAPGAAGSGLGLTFGNAEVPSLQARAGARAGYTFSGSWGVFEPNLHATYIWELRNNADTFSAQLENAAAASANLAVILKTDPPEGHYTANGGGVNFQLAHGVAGFLDYEQLRTLKTIRSHEFSFGLRYQFGL